MFRVESQLELLTAAEGRFAEATAISLRGYSKEEPIIPPAQFKDVKPVSVGQVVGFCPSHRDLVLTKRDKVKDTEETWPRAAGRVIERVLAHAFGHHAAATDAIPLSGSVDEIAKAAQSRVIEYATEASGAKRFTALDKLVVDSGHFANDSLKRLLVDSITIDLFHQQGALNYKRKPEAPNERALNNLEMNPDWAPPDFIKLSKSTPDFVVTKHKAIGDIKSGAWTDEYYLTAAGYALAYECFYQTNINLGAIYLVEMEPVIFGQSRVVVFPITDSVRRRFLDRRNQALAALAEQKMLPLRLTKPTLQRHFCDRCGVRKECFKRDGVDV